MSNYSIYQPLYPLDYAYPLLVSRLHLQCKIQENVKEIKTQSMPGIDQKCSKVEELTPSKISKVPKTDASESTSHASEGASEPTNKSLKSSSSNLLMVEIPQKPTKEELPSPVKRYFLGRYSKYLEKFQQSLANEMPDTFNMLNTFSVGLRDFILDFRDYVKVLIKLSLPFYDLEDLSRHEIELYHDMPRQMFKVAPVIILSSFPFAQNVVFPIAYWFPKRLLCYHFWDIKQRHEFSIASLTKRLHNARPVFRSMQARLDDIKDERLKTNCQSVFFSLGSGIHPSTSEISDVKELFENEPFHVKTMHTSHIKNLLKLHNRSVWFFRRRRVVDHSHYIHCMDKALNKEGVHFISQDQMRKVVGYEGYKYSFVAKIS